MPPTSRRRLLMLSRQIRKGLRADLSRIAKGVGILLGRTDPPPAPPPSPTPDPIHARNLPDPRIDPAIPAGMPTKKNPVGSKYYPGTGGQP